jgi:RimJ/RimL family protein N-acetyltransferase
VLRESEARDRAAFIELLASPEVHTYLGGPRPRDELERETPGAPERWPGSFVVDLDGEMIGSMRLAAKLGFTEVERFQAWDAEQWLGLRPSVARPLRAGPR